MRKFRFRLGVLLEVRRRREEQAMLALSLQEKALAGLELEREKLCQAVEAQRRRLVFPPESGLQVEDIQQDYLMLEYLEQTVARKDRQIELCRQEVERLRQKLVEYRRERETVEKIRQKHLRRWQQEEARLDQLTLDEVGSIAFNRQRAEAGQVRTWILFGIMLGLIVLLIYVTGTSAGRAWVEQVSRKFVKFEIAAAKPHGSGVAGETRSVTVEATWTKAEVEAPPTIDSVRAEQQRLSRWEESLQETEKRVKLELIALAEMRDEIAALQTEVQARIEQLEQLEKDKASAEAKQRSERLDKLAKLYANSRAKDAAQMLMQLDLETTAEIIHRMNEKDVVKIIQEMNKLSGSPGGPSGSQRAKELLDLYAEKALMKLPSS